MATGPVFETNLPGLNLLARGKVRDIYDLGDHLLIVATDRISAYDVVMPNGIPDKGRILTTISSFWFKALAEVVDNHLITTEVENFPEECQDYAEELANRSMLVAKAEPLPAECIIRGYLSGSGWKDYQSHGSVCGIKLTEGLVESARLESKPLCVVPLADTHERLSAPVSQEFTDLAALSYRFLRPAT